MSPFGQGVVDGIKGYGAGLGELAGHMTALNGGLGEAARLQAQANALTVSNALDWASNNSGLVNSGLYTALVNASPEQTAHLQAQMGSRVAFGSMVSVATYGLGSVLVPAAAYGNMLAAARVGSPYLEIIRQGTTGPR